MLDKKIIELINKDIDAVATDAERTYLANYIRENKEAGQYYNEIKTSMDLLANVEKIDPPSNLRKRILNSIDPGLYSKRNEKRFFKSFLDSLIPKSRPRYAVALAFGVGIIAGILAFSIFLINTGQYQKYDDLYGTIGINESIDFKIINNIPYDLSELKGRINVHHFEKLILFEVDLNSYKEINLNLNFIPGEFIFENFKPLDQQQYSLKVKDGTISTTASGNNKFIIIFEHLSETPSKIKLELSHAGNLLSTEEIPIPVDIE